MPPIQLSRNHIRPLLKFVNGKQRGPDVKAMDEPEDVMAPPADSDENNTDATDFGDPRYDSSDDEPGRGDISRANFKPNSTSQKPGIAALGGTALTTQNNDSPKRRSARSDRKRAIEIAVDPDADESGVSSAKKRAKTTDSTLPSSLGSHMGDGFLVGVNAKLAKPGYGKKAVKPNTSRDTTPKRGFQRVKSMSESVSPQVARTFKILSPGSEASSPFKKPGVLKGSRRTKKEGSSSLSDIDSDDVLSDPPRPVTSLGNAQQPKHNQNQKGTRRYRKMVAKNKSQELPAEEAVSQRPEFKMPEGYNDFASTIDRAGIEMPVYEITTTEKKTNLGPGQAECPMCEEPVDKQFLNEYSKGQRMSIARQAKFCRQHKKRTAEELWKTKGYPNIDWKGLGARIAEHHPHIKSLINGATSHFGERLRKKIEMGKDRTLFTTDEYPVPGYYGLRGMSAMTESIVDAFSGLLRERAPLDKLISARGHTGYVQSVLVPELGMRLIKEDMGIVDDGEARAVMRESKDIGVILNDERAEQPRVASQAQAGSGSEGDGAKASGINHNGTGKDDGGDGDEEVDLRIQRVDDSNSDASSLSSLGGHGPKASGKERLDDGDPKPQRLTSLDKIEEPFARGRDVVDDSDSDLSSLVSLDKL